MCSRREGKGLGALRLLGEGEFLDGIEALNVEIVDPEFVAGEVGLDVGDEVLEGLGKVGYWEMVVTGMPV
jgi:hypothetical protein